MLPKGDTGKFRPLGIPTMHDRAMQALYNFALSPIAEVKGDPNSFGFRPRRSTHDAAQVLFTALNPATKPNHILDADSLNPFLTIFRINGS